MTVRTGELTVTRVRGVRVGHAESEGSPTGVTALVFDRPSPTVVDVRGGASCTYDTASLSLDATFGRRWAIFFSGGSVFGLDAGRGIRTRVLEAGGGHTVFGNPTRVAPISGATLFDLPGADGPIPDYAPIGYAAAANASRGVVPMGQVGAGAGAWVGKYLGRDRAMPGGIGSAALLLPGRHALGVLVILNSVGAVRDPSNGRWIAGARGRNGRIVPPGERKGVPRARAGDGRGTNLLALVTDIGLPRAALQRLAVQAGSGLAQVVAPVHTATDGDVTFATCTEESSARAPLGSRFTEMDALGHEAAELVKRAAIHAVTATGP